jgi:hypothetical protein
MNSRSAVGSLIQYWQCPFCARTYASQYGEVFARGAGARQVEKPPPREEVSGAPQATREEIRRTQLKMRAARWFARLEQEGARAEPPPAPRQSTAATSGPIRNSSPVRAVR